MSQVDKPLQRGRRDLTGQLGGYFRIDRLARAGSEPPEHLCVMENLWR